MATDEPSSDAAETETAPDSAETPLEDVAENPARRWPASRRPILLTALVVAALVVAAALFFFQYRPDSQVDDAAAGQAVRAASDGAVALLSYSSDSLDHDFAAAKSHLTGSFLDYYTKFSAEVVGPAVRGKHLSQKAVVIRAAVSQLHPDSAVVLAFVNQTVTSKDKKDPVMTPSVVRITLAKVDGSWLISKLDPVG